MGYTISVVAPLLLLTTICSGRRLEEDQPLIPCNARRIIGGNPADISRIPFQVALNVNRGPNCGGSLISRRWVLTAAHCVYELKSTDKLQVRINSTYGLAFGKVVGVESTVMHPDYNPLTLDFDFALLELERDVELGEEFYAAELPEQDESIEDGTCLQASGWGMIGDGEISEYLRLIDIPLINWEKCRQVFRKMHYLSERMICAGDINARLATCHGDSGGPLVDGRKLIGVVSWGYPDICAGYPGVFGKVSSVRTWIKFVSEV